MAAFLRTLPFVQMVEQNGQGVCQFFLLDRISQN
jgi:hypothetical protein